MAQLVGEHEAVRARRERRVDDGPPEEDAPACTEARCKRVRLAEAVQHAHWDVDVLSALERRNIRRLKGASAEQPGRDEGEERPQSDEDRRGRQPPPPADAPGKAHHDREGGAEENELRAECEPFPDRRVDVAAGEPVAVTPPDVQHFERQLGAPDEREADHPEQHPGADRPSRGLAHPTDAITGEKPEHRELRDRLTEPEKPLHPAVVLRAVQNLRREEDLLAEVRQVVRRQRRSPEQPSRDRPDSSEREDERRAAARHSTVVSPPSSGLACGYESVSKSKKPSSCASYRIA